MTNNEFDAARNVADQSARNACSNLYNTSRDDTYMDESHPAHNAYNDAFVSALNAYNTTFMDTHDTDQATQESFKAADLAAYDVYFEEHTDVYSIASRAACEVAYQAAYKAVFDSAYQAASWNILETNLNSTRDLKELAINAYEDVYAQVARILAKDNVKQDAAAAATRSALDATHNPVFKDVYDSVYNSIYNDAYNVAYKVSHKIAHDSYKAAYNAGYKAAYDAYKVAFEIDERTRLRKPLGVDDYIPYKLLNIARDAAHDPAYDAASRAAFVARQRKS